MSINDAGDELNVDTVDITDFVLAAGEEQLFSSAEDGGATLRIASGLASELFLRNQLGENSSNIEKLTYAGNNLFIAQLETFDELQSAINDLVANTDRAPFLLQETTIALNEDDAPVSINLGGVVVDQDEDPITFNLKSKPNFGEATLSGSTLTFDRGADEFGETTVLLEARSGDAKPTKFTIPIEVTAANDGPVAVDDVATLRADQNSIVIDELKNDFDVEGDAITIDAVPEKGNVTIQADGTLLYTRDENILSPDQFFYTIEDEPGLKGAGLVTVTVVSVGAPVANDDQVNATAAKLLEGLRLDVLKNDTIELGRKGIDRDSLAIVDGPDEGTLTTSKGRLTYRADGDFDGQDSFTYTVADIAGRVSDVATVVINGPDLTI